MVYIFLGENAFGYQNSIDGSKDNILIYDTKRSQFLEVLVNGVSIEKIQLRTKSNRMLWLEFQIQIAKYFPNEGVHWIILHSSETMEFAYERIMRSQSKYSIILSQKYEFDWRQWGYLYGSTVIANVGEVVAGRVGLARIQKVPNFSEAWKLIRSHTRQPNQYVNSLPQVNPEKEVVLIVSYYGGQARSVATNRVNYWAENIKTEYLKRGRDPEIIYISAFEGDTDNEQYKAVCIRDLHDKGAKQSAAISEYNELTKMRINTVGYFWGLEVTKFLFKSGRAYNLSRMISSGNPYFHFSIGQKMKKRFPAMKFALDYRDPFSGNSRIQYTKEQRNFLREFERRLNKSADLIVSVNKTSLESISADAKIKKAVISNGFDERISTRKPEGLPGHIDLSEIEKLKKHGKKIFAYTGSFYPSCPPDVFLKALDKESVLVHLGSQVEHALNEKSKEKYRYLGSGTVSDVQRLLEIADAGLVYTSQQFETTTKIFDYVQADKPIIIVHQNVVVDQHEIKATFGDLNGSFWVANKVEEIRKVLRNMEFKFIERSDKEKYSRGAGLRALIDELEGESGE
jgi:hypothetical protein